MSSRCRNGLAVFLRYKNTTVQPCLRKLSAILAPRIPVEKFSIDRTGSIGIEVGPDVIIQIPHFIEFGSILFINFEILVQRVKF